MTEDLFHIADQCLKMLLKAGHKQLWDSWNLDTLLCQHDDWCFFTCWQSVTCSVLSILFFLFFDHLKDDLVFLHIADWCWWVWDVWECDVLLSMLFLYLHAFHDDDDAFSPCFSQSKSLSWILMIFLMYVLWQYLLKSIKSCVSWQQCFY